ncbi:MAG: hypothetical protein IMY78_03500 [Chloroflexi bacterium]|nr:hypothetical protein [Chloroflexota bacterium]
MKQKQVFLGGALLGELSRDAGIATVAEQVFAQEKQPTTLGELRSQNRLTLTLLFPVYGRGERI